MPEPPARPSDEGTPLDPHASSDAPDATAAGDTVEERPVRGLLARAGRAETRPDDPDTWRRSVLLRFDRIERLVERVASGVPPLQELGRKTAEHGERQLAHLSQLGDTTLRQLGELSKEIENARERAVQDFETIVEREGGERGAEIVQGLHARIAEAVEGAETRIAEAVERIGETVAQANAGLSESIGTVTAAQTQLARGSEALAKAIQDERKATADTLREFTRSSETSLRRSTEEVLDALREQAEAVTLTLRDEVRGDLDALRQGVQAELAGVREAVGTDIAGVREMVQSSTTAIDNVAEAARSSLADAAESAGTSVRDAAASAVPAIRKAVDAASRAMQAALQTHADALRGEVEQATGEMATGHAAVGELVSSLTQQEQHAVDVLGGAIQRIEGLAEIIESLGARRGFRRLVESEEELRQQQARLVGDLKTEGERLAARIDEVHVRMDSVDAEAERISASQAEAAERVAEDLDRAVETVRAELGERIPIDQSLADVRDLAEAHRDLDKATTMLHEEVEVLRKRIESWGTPRSAPSLAANLASLGERVESVEAVLGEQMERLEQLIRGGEEQLRRMTEGRRGVFRR